MAEINLIHSMSRAKQWKYVIVDTLTLRVMMQYKATAYICLFAANTFSRVDELIRIKYMPDIKGHMAL